MGLDISAYEDLQEANGNEAFDGTGELLNDDWFQLYINHGFPGRADEINDQHAYKAKTEYNFCAGSYGGYNNWRNELAKIAGYPAIEVDRYNTGNKQNRHDQGAWESERGPFWELINFSDCEGVIGAKVSKKLVADFMEFQKIADNSDYPYFAELYKKWRKAFEIAANNGCVVFG